LYFRVHWAGRASICSACHNQYKLKFSWIIGAIFMAVWTAGGVASAGVLSTIIGPSWALDFGMFTGTLALCVPGLIMALPISRLCESKFGQLMPVNSNTSELA
jgi:hypothetical protein